MSKLTDETSLRTGQGRDGRAAAEAKVGRSARQQVADQDHGHLTLEPSGTSERLQRTRRSSDTSSTTTSTTTIQANTKISREQRNSDEPLIHTDQYNASSGPLFVHSPKLRVIQFQQSRREQHPIEMRRQNMTTAQIIVDNNNNNNNNNNNRRADPFSPAHISILAADGPPLALDLRVDESNASTGGNMADLVPRFDVLDLQVGSSQATLSWSLSLHSAVAKGEHTDRALKTLRRRRDVSETRPPSLDEATVADLLLQRLERSTPSRSPNLQPSGSAATLSDEPQLSHAPRILVQPLPANTPSRRPPARAQVPGGAPPSNAELAPTDGQVSSRERPQTSSRSTSTAATRRPQHKASNGATVRLQQVGTAQTSGTEPPMIRISSAPLNRISSGPPTNKSTGGTNRAPKMLQLDRSPAPSSTTLSSSTTAEPSSTTSSSSTTAEPSSTSSAPMLAADPKGGPQTSDATTRTDEWPSSTHVADELEAPRESTTTSGSTTSVSAPLSYSSTKSPTSSAASSSSTTPPSSPATSGDSSLTNSDQPRRTSKAPQVSQRRIESARPPSESKWLVRLRRFGSNEIDIVKIVLSDLSPETSSKRQVRQITFKSLEPASAYEICLESASPDQQIGDPFRILNANHFLKCQDTSEVELASIEAPEAEQTEARSTRQIRRLDLASESRASSDDEHPARAKARLKSLCREFFTLPIDNDARKAAMVSLVGKAAPSEPLESGGDLAAAQRRAKALGIESRPTPLLGHVELLEISYANETAAAAASKHNFEVVSVSSSLAAAPSAPGRSGRASLLTNATGSNNLSARHLLPSMAGAATSNYLPIVGCILMVIVLASIANVLLSSLSCSSSGGGSKSPPPSARSRRARRPKRRISASPPGAGHQLAGSYNSAASSEHSVGSHARIVVVGHNGAESFTNASAYFDLPPERDVPTGAQLSAKQSVYLLSNAARFPLGPSFEGDEKHNADMVGLARRNYDQFINNIYNVDSLAHELSNAELNSARSDPSNSRSASAEQPQQATSFLRRDSPATADRRPLVGHSSPVSSSSDSSTANGPAARQRIRFDKVNPIYNMDGIHARAQQHQHAAGPRLSVSSFSTVRHKRCPSDCPQNGPAIQMRELEAAPARDACKAQCCNVCACCGATNGAQQRECELVECTCDAEQQCSSLASRCDQVAGGTFSRCLDKQKQRLQAQQQQLGRVLTKNGALLPQPYISNADGPLESRTELESRQNDEQRELSLASESEHDNLGKQARPHFEFGDEETRKPNETWSPPPPPPPPPLPSLLSNPDEREASSESSGTQGVQSRRDNNEKKPLVDVVASATTQHQSDSETINKTDFAQRREELASKLQLAGMNSNK